MEQPHESQSKNDDPLAFEVGSLQAHLYIAAMGRSGSTMLANLLTRPPNHWVMVEPWLPIEGFSKILPQQMNRFGYEVTEQDGNNPLSLQEHLIDLVSGPLSQVSRWGVKEVQPRLHEETMRLIQPQKVIILVRDIREVALSFLEKHERPCDPLPSMDWLWGYLISSANSLIGLKDNYGLSDFKVVRYEEFVADPAVRQELSLWLDWPMDGDVGANLDLYQRDYECERHGPKITPNSVGRRHSESSSTKLQFAADVAHATAQYQSTFGYFYE